MLSKIIDYFRDFLFPKKELVSKLEKLTPYEFAELATSAAHVRDRRVLFAYHDPHVHEALWELKYHKNTKMAELFAPLILEALIGELADECLYTSHDTPIITAIPASTHRMRTRYFDQNLLLLNALRKEDSDTQFMILPHLLTRTKDTLQQSHTHNKHERLENMEHAFKVENGTNVHGKVVIVIDDIVTTGATLRDAHRALLEAGARKVYMFAIAH